MDQPLKALLNKQKRQQTEDYALAHGLSDEAAEEALAARHAAQAKGNNYEINGHQYRATSRIDAQMQHQDWSNVLAPLWAVVELI